MKEFVPVLKRTKLFSGVGDDDISTMLSCLEARLLTYKKGEYVLRQGEHLSDILVLAEGSLHIQRDDYWGNRSILGHIGVGEIFGEAYVAPESGTLLNDVIAVEDSSVFFFGSYRICSLPYPKRTGALCRNWTTCQDVQQEKNCFHICLRKPKSKTAPASPFHLTGSSWRITFLLTGAPCQTSFVRCGTKGSWSLRKTASDCSDERIHIWITQKKIRIGIRSRM